MKRDLPIILWVIWVITLGIAYANQEGVVQWGWSDTFTLKFPAPNFNPPVDVKIYQWNQLTQERIE